MDPKRAWGLSLDELQCALRSVDPAALLAPPRILRRVIKQERHIPGPGLRVPHRKTFVVDRRALLNIAEPAELGVEQGEGLSENVLLLARPEPEHLAAMTRQRALVKYWRLLFHARLHATLDQRISSEALNVDVARERIAALGEAAFEEARGVLRQDEFLLPPADELSVYAEFVVVYAELRQFAPALARDYFPSLVRAAEVDALIALDVDVKALFEQTRLPGAGDPTELLADVGEAEAEEADGDAMRFAAQPRKESERVYCRLMQRADKARAAGNVVRSALVRTQAALFIRPKLARTTRTESLADIARLVERLQTALDLDAETARRWEEALAPLVHPSGAAFWTAEARLLYDLQKVCVDHERGVYKLDLWRWIRSFGRKPLRRPLPAQREVLMSKHLRSAARRLRAARVSPGERVNLGALLDDAVRRADDHVRAQLRPRVEDAMNRVQLLPRNLPECVARRKLVEELLDRAVRRGFLNMGDLRDAVSRNQLKIGDVESAREVFTGDQLLRLDRRLATSLDGVYRGGEIYLRISQSISALAFGTNKGRWLTKYVFVPYGGAYIVLLAMQHVIETLPFVVRRLHRAGLTAHPTAWATWLSTLALGTFIVALIHRPRFRHACVEACKAAFRGIRWLFVGLPNWLMGIGWVRRLLESPEFRLAGRYVIKPLVFTVLVLAVIALVRRRAGSWGMSVGVFVALNALLNSRIGRDVDEMVTDLAVRTWHQLRFRVLAGMFKAIADAFHQMLEVLERVLYAVDEWLRFRRGESRATTAVKVVLGSIWSVVRYVVRFVVTLLVEPQVNPIKHFPVVTVSHKIMITVGAGYMTELLMLTTNMTRAEAFGMATLIGTLIPGIFGFLAWELKENWRLYAANRPKHLTPAIVGRHGETMTRLLRPGFHSGTLAKSFQRLRRADRRAYMSGRWQVTRKHHEAIENVRESIAEFVEREFITLLELSEQWPRPIRLGGVQVGTTSARIELRSGDEPPCWLALEERSGWLAARVLEPGWLGRLSADERVTLANALVGLYSMCGVEIVSEEAQSCFGSVLLRLDDDGLVVSPAGAVPRSFVYRLRDVQESPGEDPLILPEPLTATLPAPPRSHLMFSARPIPWTTWVCAWESASPTAIERPRRLLGRDGSRAASPAVA